MVSLVALEDVVAEAIQNDEIVRLGDLCTLQVGLSGKGALTEEEYNDNLITVLTAIATTFTTTSCIH